MGSSWTQSSCYNSNTRKKNCQEYSVDKNSRETATEFRNFEAAKMRMIAVSMYATRLKIIYCSNHISLEKMACLMQCLECLHRNKEARVNCSLGNVQPSCLRIYQSCCLGIYQLCCLGIYQSYCLGIYQFCCLGIYEPSCLAGNDQPCSLNEECSAWLPSEGYVQHGYPGRGCSSITTQKEDVSVWLPRRGEISFATLFRMILCDFRGRGLSSLAPRKRLSSFVKTIKMWSSSEEEEHKLSFVAPVLQLDELPRDGVCVPRTCLIFPSL